jgi:16S rRNA G966 N2-methylase RsmD
MRNRVLELWEVERYGSDSRGDADYVSIYGLAPAAWHEMGIRVLGRTAVECTRDQLADAIGRDTASAANSAPRTAGVTVIDPFAGSGNTLFWILRHLPQAHGVGFELDDAVFQLTRENLSILGSPLEIVSADYMAALRELRVLDDQLLVAFIAPPWGSALSASDGLDLSRTTPPVTEIVDSLVERFPNRLLFSIQVYERIEPLSLAELTARFEWSALRIYDFDPPGQNHGLLLATCRWRP